MKKIISFILSSIFLLTIFVPVIATENHTNLMSLTEDISGNKGNISWTLTTTGTLTISGIGDMPDYFTSTGSLLDTYISNINTIVINDGVTSIGDSAFYNYDALISVSIPESVTSIGFNAFRSCSALISVSIPKSVTSIGSGAFYDCNSLETINIPNSVTSIDDNIFHGCHALTSIYLPDSVKSIGIYAFYDCRSLATINISNRVTSIGDGAFYGCSALTTIDIPNGVTSISDKIFYDCGALTTINIPEGVTSIGDDAFGDCEVLESIDLPNSIKSIGNRAFDNCSKLRVIILPKEITSIGSNAFRGCKLITSISIPDKVAFIGDGAFSQCALEEIIVDANNEYYLTENKMLFDRNKTILIQCSIDVTGECEIPLTVKTIGSGAFYGCRSLTIIDIPNGVTSIGNEAFWGCCSLTTINIPEGVTSIGDRTFYGCRALTTINISEGVTSIGWGTFWGCSSLISINIPKSVNQIKFYAFYGCNKLNTVMYDGNSAGWNSIDISSSGNTNLLNADISFICTVTYDYKTNGGTADIITEKNIRVGIEADLSPTAVKNDYIFIGWNTDPNATTALESYIVTGDVTLYAIFKKSTCTVTYDYKTNGGNSTTVNTQTVRVNSEVNLTPMAVKRNWEFIGWNTDPNATTALENYIVDKDTTLYAIFRKAINANFISNNSQLQKVYLYNNDTEINMSVPEPNAYEGWTAIGWRMDYSAEKPLISVGDSINLSHDQTYYAVYSRDLPLSYDTDNVSEMDTQYSIQYYNSYGNKSEVTFVLSDAPEKDGFKFRYWTVNGINGEQYREGDTIVISEPTTMYAVWGENIYVTYDYSENGGTSATKEYYISDFNSYADLTPTAEKTGWEFVGWNTDKDAHTALNNYKITDHSVTLYAIFEKDITADFYTIENTLKDKITKTIYNKETSATFKIPSTNCSAECILGWEYDGEIHMPDNEVTLEKDTSLKEVWKTRPPKAITESGAYVLGTQYIVFQPYLPTGSSAIPTARIYYTTDGTDPTPDSNAYLTQNPPVMTAADLTGTGTMTVKAVAQVPNALPSDIVECQYYKAEAPSIIALESTTATEAFIRFNQPKGAKKINVRVSSGGDWTPVEESILESDDVIKATGLKPKTQYWFEIECEFQNEKLYSNQIVGTTKEYISSECDIKEIVFSPASTIDQENLVITSPRMTNVFDEVRVELEVSRGAKWWLYPTKQDAVRGTNPIEDKILALTAGKTTTSYVKVIAEDGQTHKIYSMPLYRQSKSSPPTFSIPQGYVKEGTMLMLKANGELIKYTTDGTTPSANNGIVYTEPIEISKDVTIKAIAKEEGMDEFSDVITKVYYISDENISTECDILSVVSPSGAVVDSKTLSISDIEINSDTQNLTVDVNVSEGAKWELYRSKTDAEKGINSIKNILDLSSEQQMIIYIKVIAEDDYTYNIYNMTIYRSEKISTPTFSVPSGSVVKGTLVDLNADGKLIKYTTDGSDPSEDNGKIYTEPIVIDRDMTVKAIARSDSTGKYSDIATNVYSVSKETVIPKIINADLDDNGYYFNFNIFNNTDNELNVIAMVALYDGDNLINVKVSDELLIDSNDMMQQNIEMRFDSNDKVKYYKLFVWDGLSTMKPVLDIPHKGEFN